MTDSEFVIQSVERRVRRRRQEELSRLEEEQIIIPATITTVGGDVFARWDPNVLWVRMHNSQQGPTAVWNGGVVSGTSEELAGTGVLLKRAPKGPYPYQVYGLDPTRVVQGGQSTSTSRGNVGEHGANHQVVDEDNVGPDPVYIYEAAWRPLKTEGDGSSLVVWTWPLTYVHNGAREKFTGQHTDLSSHVPGSGDKRAVLLYLDKGANAMRVKEGSTVTSSAPSVPFPSIPDGAISSAYVELENGQTAVSTADDITNARPILNMGNGLPRPLTMEEATTLTLSSGAVTVTGDYHVIAAESGTADDLDTITAAEVRQVLVVQADAGDTITLKHGTGNISFNGEADFDLEGDKTLLLFYNGDEWSDVGIGGGGGASALDDLSDVTISSPADDEVLAYDDASGEWINQTAAEAGLAEDDHTHTESDISDLDHTDDDAIHDNVAGEIAAITEKALPIAADKVLIEDSEDSDNKKYAELGNLPGSGKYRQFVYEVSGGDFSFVIDQDGNPVMALQELE